MSELVVYERMVNAIAECHRVDEVKDYRDKARALEMYARQADNLEAERRACDIRLRAERRAGELLKELARATPLEVAKSGGTAKAEKLLPASVAASRPSAPRSPYRAALTQAKIPERTAQRYQALAEVPKETFEAALSSPEKPTTAGLLAKAQAMRVVNEARDPPFKMPPSDSLWLWGRLKDFEREGFLKKDPAKLLAPMTEPMRKDVTRLLPLCVAFLNSMNEANHEHV